MKSAQENNIFTDSSTKRIFRLQSQISSLDRGVAFGNRSRPGSRMRVLPREEDQLSRNCFVQLVPATSDHLDFSRTKNDDEHEYDPFTSESGINITFMQPSPYVVHQAI